MRRMMLTTVLAAACLVPGLAHAQSCGQSVTVTLGDTLHQIARRCGTTVSALAGANPQIEDPDVIRVGWTLTIPGTGDEPPVAERPDEPQDPAPSQPSADYTVRPGDTLAEIAARHDVRLSALLAANPQIDDPNVIHIGQNLEIPRAGGDDDAAPPARSPGWAGEVEVYPQEGAPGTTVRVHASGFPPNTAVNVGAGPVASEYEILREALRTDAAGELVAQVELPGHADPRGRWVFVVETDDRRLRGRSEPFDVLAGDGEGGGPDDVVRVEGVLTEGVECPAVRADDGTLYTLAGDLEGFTPGDRVVVEGTETEVSVCMQGTTLAVNDIRAARP